MHRITHQKTRLKGVALLDRDNSDSFNFTAEWLIQAMRGTAELLQHAQVIMTQKVNCLRCLDPGPAKNLQGLLPVNPKTGVLDPKGDIDEPDPRFGNTQWIAVRLALGWAHGRRPIHSILVPGGEPAPIVSKRDEFTRLFDGGTIRPPDASEWLADAAKEEKWFAREPLQGGNPCVIAKFHGTLPTDLHPTDPTQVYVCDYGEIAPAAGGTKRWTLPARAFFKPDGAGGLKALGIDWPREDGTRLFVGTTDVAWPTAKTIVRCANQAHHILLSHMPRTHFFYESVGVATMMKLRDDHPVRVLIEQHLEGTFAFNKTALQAALDCVGWFRWLAPGTQAGRIQVMSDSILKRPFEQFGFEADLKARGLWPDPTTAPAFTYRYRDDGMLYWDALGEWVREYVSLFYRDDATVQADRALRDWHAYLSAPDGPNLCDVPPLDGVDDLVRILRILVWVPTAGHAAIHNALHTQDTYVPASPNALYGRPPPDATLEGSVEYTSVLPFGAYQLALNHFGGTHINSVAEYDLSRFPDRRVLPALNRHRDRIREIAKTIDARNAGLTYPYTLLHPNEVTRSIHV